MDVFQPVASIGPGRKQYYTFQPLSQLSNQQVNQDKTGPSVSTVPSLTTQSVEHFQTQSVTNLVNTEYNSVPIYTNKFANTGDLKKGCKECFILVSLYLKNKNFLVHFL
eukprot:TRINITY_DN17555_c0_g1_i1.p1 TRINITY_DN17555_c0_g1~~TRINITY_DN17555_c0_g1_i1.p1  ORF type:complete len:109 (+),score=17.66 TRINITY_DN17555_c0_g1_i1:151-477(+)